MAEEKKEVTDGDKIIKLKVALKFLETALAQKESMPKYIVVSKGLGCLVNHNSDGTKDIKMVIPNLSTKFSKKEARKLAGHLTATVKPKRIFTVRTRHDAINSMILYAKQEILRLEAE